MSLVGDVAHLLPARSIAAMRAGASRGAPMFPTALIAETFDMAGQKDSATVYYEQFVSTGLVGQWIIAEARFGPAFRRRLGELFEERGQFDKAYDTYASFVQLWKHADAELQPVVANVRARMNRLESRRAR